MSVFKLAFCHPPCYQSSHCCSVIWEPLSSRNLLLFRNHCYPDSGSQGWKCIHTWPLGFLASNLPVYIATGLSSHSSLLTCSGLQIGPWLVHSSLLSASQALTVPHLNLLLFSHLQTSLACIIPYKVPSCPHDPPGMSVALQSFSKSKWYSFLTLKLIMIFYTVLKCLTTIYGFFNFGISLGDTCFFLVFFWRKTMSSGPYCSPWDDK